MQKNIIIVNPETPQSEVQNARSVIQPQPDGVNVLLELVAEEGMRLTQAEDVSIEDRIVCRGVVLPNGMTDEFWKEISEDEAQQILEEKKILEDLERETEKPVIPVIEDEEDSEIEAVDEEIL